MSTRRLLLAGLVMAFGMGAAIILGGLGIKLLHMIKVTWAGMMMLGVASVCMMCVVTQTMILLVVIQIRGRDE